MKTIILTILLCLFLASITLAQDLQDLSHYGDAVITDTTTKNVIDHAESVAFDSQREEWVVKVQSMKNNTLLTTRYPRSCRVFVEEGELIPMPVKNGKRIVKLFQLYTDRKDIPIEYYFKIRDNAYQASVN